MIVKLAIGFSDGAEGKSTFRSRLSVSEGNPKQIIFHNQAGGDFMRVKEISNISQTKIIFHNQVGGDFMPHMNKIHNLM